MEQRRLLWTAILCLVVLLQQFSPGFADCTVDYEGDVVEDEDEPVDDDDTFADEVYGHDDPSNDYEEDAVRNRSFLSGIAQLKFSPLKVGRKHEKELAALIDLTAGFPVPVRSKCSALYPSIKDNWDTIEKLTNKFKDISTQMDDRSLEAAIRQCYAKHSIRLYQKARKRMEIIAFKQKILLDEISPKFNEALRNSTIDIERTFSNKSATVDEVDAMQVESMYESSLKNASSVVAAVMTFAMPGFRNIYKHIKETVIGSKLNEMEDKLQLKLGFNGSVDDLNYQKLAGSKFMAAENSADDSRMERLKSNVLKKYKSANRLFSRVQRRLRKLFSLGKAAFSIWSSFGDTITNCREIRDLSTEASVKMKYFVANATEYLENVKKAHQMGEEAWKLILDAAWEKSFIFALENVKEMMSDTDFTKDTDVSTTVLRAIEEYIEATNQTGISSNVNNLQTKLTYALHAVPVALKCHELKAIMFKKVSERCTEGRDTFEQIYENVKRLVQSDSDQYKCQLRAGKDFFDPVSMEEAWKNSLEGNDTDNGNDTVKERCVQNNKMLMDTITKELHSGATVEDAEKIADRIDKPDWADDIEVLLRTLPKPDAMNIPDEVKKHICLFKDALKNKMSDEKIAALVKNTYPFVTLKVYKDQDCSNVG